MNKLGVYGQYIQDGSLEVVKSLLQIFEDRGCFISIEEGYHEMLKAEGVATQIDSFKNLDASYDALISIGGDGTILRAVAFIGRDDIPVVGINTGRLGFLATIKVEKLEESMKALFNGDYRLSKRSLITASSNLKDEQLSLQNFALNEVTVSRMNTTSMIQIETQLNGELLTNYWADGLIVSTPTGSTGYSLSCGGPVISPTTQGFVITPIAPHNLNARPLVIPDDTEITLKVSGRENEFLTSLDNRICSFPNDTVITLKKADFTIDLVELKQQSFIKTLRHKLLWGEDKRN
ncbi:MAG: NAD kinase [Nonlabens sp.]